MNIQVQFNPELERVVNAASTNDWGFKIFVLNQEESYPDEAWYDAGALLVDGWIWEFNQAVSETGTGCLVFQEGPFWLDFVIVGDRVRFYTRQDPTTLFTVDSLSHFAEELNAARQRILEYHQKNLTFPLNALQTPAILPSAAISNAPEKP